MVIANLGGKLTPRLCMHWVRNRGKQLVTVKYKSYAQSATLYITVKYYALSPASCKHIHAKAKIN